MESPGRQGGYIVDKGLNYIQIVLDFLLKLISFFKKNDDQNTGK